MQTAPCSCYFSMFDIPEGDPSIAEGTPRTNQDSTFAPTEFGIERDLF
jgi:hypothetical protein